MTGIESIDMSGPTIKNAPNFKVAQTHGCIYRSDLRGWSIYDRQGWIRFNLKLGAAHGVNFIPRLCSGLSRGKTDCPVTISANGNVLVRKYDPHRVNYYDEAWYIPIGFLKKGDNEIKIQMDGGTTVVFIRAAKITNFEMQHQQQTQWCWAAHSTSVARYFEPTCDWTQCKVVNSELNRSDCCTKPSSANCNKPWYLDLALKRVGHFDRMTESVEPTATIQGLATRKRPLGARIGWRGGGGHFMVLTGTRTVNRQSLVGVEDPWYGSSFIPYTTFRDNYQGKGSWTHTYFVK